MTIVQAHRARIASWLPLDACIVGQHTDGVHFSRHRNANLRKAEQQAYNIRLNSIFGPYDIDENRLLRWRKRFGSKTALRSSPFGYNRASAEHRPFGKDGAALTQLHLQHICCVGPNLSSTDRPSCSGANHHPDGSTPLWIVAQLSQHFKASLLFFADHWWDRYHLLMLSISRRTWNSVVIRAALSVWHPCGLRTGDVATCIGRRYRPSSANPRATTGMRPRRRALFAAFRRRFAMQTTRRPASPSCARSQTTLMPRTTVGPRVDEESTGTAPADIEPLHLRAARVRPRIATPMCGARGERGMHSVVTRNAGGVSRHRSPSVAMVAALNAARPA
ncbi:hypothetical protein L1887_54038 [Cichorium endivia]|nr:hypothetical protein L1887_54038 [Cichorium endivia]